VFGSQVDFTRCSTGSEIGLTLAARLSTYNVFVCTALFTCAKVERNQSSSRHSKSCLVSLSGGTVWLYSIECHFPSNTQSMFRSSRRTADDVVDRFSAECEIAS
jgi:hypothetical protein